MFIRKAQDDENEADNQRGGKSHFFFEINWLFY